MPDNSQPMNPVYFDARVEKALAGTNLAEHTAELQKILAYNASSETNFGEWRRQSEYTGKPGPGRGVFSMEPNTAKEIFETLEKHSWFKEFKKWMEMPGHPGETLKRKYEEEDKKKKKKKPKGRPSGR